MMGRRRGILDTTALRRRTSDVSSQHEGERV